MKQYNLAAMPDPPRWEAIQKQYQIAHEQEAVWTNSHDEFLIRRNSSLLALTSEVGIRQQELFSVLGPLIIALRRELDLKVDEDEYTRSLLAQADMAREQVEAVVGRLRELNVLG